MKDRRSDDVRPGGFFYIQAASYFLNFYMFVFDILSFGLWKKIKRCIFREFEPVWLRFDLCDQVTLRFSFLPHVASPKSFPNSTSILNGFQQAICECSFAFCPEIPGC